MSDAPMSGSGSSQLPPKVRLVKGQEVSLGCGTLILIALIVLIFGNAQRGNRVDVGPVLDKLRAIEGRLEAIERRLPEPKAAPKDE
jgi:hypothetical protein